jgi:hypothetical protein
VVLRRSENIWRANDVYLVVRVNEINSSGNAD